MNVVTPSSPNSRNVSSIDDLIVSWQLEETSQEQSFIQAKTQVPSVQQMPEYVSPSALPLVSSQKDVSHPSTLNINCSTSLLATSTTKKNLDNHFLNFFRTCPDLGVSSPQNKHKSINKPKLPFWLNPPLNESEMPDFLQKIRSRLIYINRRIHYYENEKIALTSYLHSLTDPKHSNCSKQKALAVKKSGALLHKRDGNRSYETLMRTNRESDISYTNTLDSLVIKKIAASQKLEKEPPMGNYDETSDDSTAKLTLWGVTKGIQKNSAKQIPQMTPDNVFNAKEQIENIEDHNFANSRIASINLPTLTDSCSATPSTKNTEALLLVGRLHSSSVSSSTVQPLSLPNPVNQSSTSVHQASQTVAELECSYKRSAKRLTQKKIRRTAKQQLKPKPAASSSSTVQTNTSLEDGQSQSITCESFTPAYWNSLPSNILRMWMKFFGMKLERLKSDSSSLFLMYLKEELRSDVFPQASQCSVSTAVFSHLTSVSDVVVSRSERKYIEDGIKASYRCDGRSLLDFRPITIETDVLPSASGSVRVVSPDVTLVVAVNVEIHTLTSQHPNEGIVICNVDCAPLGQSVTNLHSGQDTSQYITQLVNRYILGPFTLDRTKLCIEKGHFAWKVYIDVLIFSGEGNLLDAVSVGIRAALLKTTLPLVTCTPVYDDVTGQESVDFVVDSRPEMGSPFPAERIPIFITCGQILSRFVWDLSPAEFVCSHIRITATIDANGQCHGIHKTGNATLPFSSILVALQNSFRISKRIHNFIEKCTLKNSKISQLTAQQ